MASHADIEVKHYDLSGISPKLGRVVHVDAGHRGVRHVVPPAGEDYAFDVDLWARRIEVYVSPTGRSVRVFVDGREVKKP